MAKFRANHQKSTIKTGLNRFVRFGLMICVLGFMVWQGVNSIENVENGVEVTENGRIKIDVSEPSMHISDLDVYENDFFRFGYDEDHEQPRWVEYELTRVNLDKNRLKRLKNFKVDRKIKEGSAHTKDYSNSGYTRGHLVPSADMSFSLESMQETYKMSNVSPQIAKFNGGIWRELEEQCRDWARKFKRLHIVTGPILNDIDETIGRNNVTVPKFFYKVLMDLDDPERKAIGFIMPHEVSYKHLNKYAVTVDEVERVTGIDFYSQLTTDSEEENLESKLNLKLWPFDNRRFELRKNQWNKRDN